MSHTSHPVYYTYRITYYPLLPVSVCSNTGDVVFLIDSSGSIQRENYGRVIDFVKSLVRQLDPSRYRMAVAYFNDEAKVQVGRREECLLYIHTIDCVIIYGQIPRNGLTLGSCPQQWGSHYYIILKIYLIDGLYSVIW